MQLHGRDGYRAAIEDLVRILTPKAHLQVATWAASNRWLSSKSSPYPGRWRNELTPYLVDVMNALDWRHPAPLVVCMKSAQTGFSDAVLNFLGWMMDQEPGAALALWPTDEAGETWVRTRVREMIRLSPPLRAKFDAIAKAEQGTLSEIHFSGGLLKTGSTGKSGDVASMSAPYLVFDEADKMPRELAREGDPVELAMARSFNYPRRKAVMVSTPTTLESSRIWPAWLASTMDRYHVPCPHCDHAQHLRWDQLKWIPGRPDGAQYACEECGAFIEERHKRDMLANGSWKATHPEREDKIKGFHINGLYAPIGLGQTWVQHASAWERAQGSETRIQVFYNIRLGEVHKGESQRLEWEEIKHRAEPFALTKPPEGMLVLTSGTDVQADRLETQVIGHGRGERIAVVDYAVHWGDTTRPEVWAELDKYLARTFTNAYGIEMPIACSMVDSQYNTDPVLSFTRSRKARSIYACRGSSTATRMPIGRPSYPDTKRRGKIDQRGAERYEVGVSMLKHWLFEMLRSDTSTEEKPVPPSERHIRFPAGVVKSRADGAPNIDGLQPEYYRQLTAEVYDPKHGWVARANYHRNEALDTFIYARAAAMHHSVQVHKYRDADWDRLEQLYEARGKSKAPEQTLGKDAIQVPSGFLPTVAKIR